ncbi:unnamed protein product [Discosporangium mesarthrocarpum]
MGHLAFGRHRQTMKLLVLDYWKDIIREKRAIVLQCAVRSWFARRRSAKRHRIRSLAQKLLQRVLSPVQRVCFVALVRNCTAMRRLKGAAALTLQCAWRCHLSRAVLRGAHEQSLHLEKISDQVVVARLRSLQRHCFLSWQRFISLQRAATKAQALVRGHTARMRAEGLRARRARFSTFVRAIESVYEGMLCHDVLEEFHLMVVQRRAARLLTTSMKGLLARILFRRKVVLVRKQQLALCRVLHTKRIELLLLGRQAWDRHIIFWEAARILQGLIRGWLIRHGVVFFLSLAAGSKGMHMSSKRLRSGSVKNALLPSKPPWLTDRNTQLLRC